MDETWVVASTPRQILQVCGDSEAPACLLACTCLGSLLAAKPQDSGLCRHEKHPSFPPSSSSASSLCYGNQAHLKLTRCRPASAPKSQESRGTPPS